MNSGNINNSIKIGDYIGVGLIKAGGGYELVTNVTSSIQAYSNDTVYVITTANRTITLEDHQFQLSGSTANTPAPGQTGVSYWVITQSE